MKDSKKERKARQIKNIIHNDTQTIGKSTRVLMYVYVYVRLVWFVYREEIFLDCEKGSAYGTYEKNVQEDDWQSKVCL